MDARRATKLAKALPGIALCCLLGLASSGAPGGGRLPGEAYAELQYYEVLSPTPQVVPERKYVLVSSQSIGTAQVEELAALGLSLVASSGKFTVVKGPLTAFAALGPEEKALPWVESVLPALSFMPDDDAFFYPGVHAIGMNEAVQAVGGDLLHNNGVRGKGVKIAVLDAGFTGRLGRTLPEGLVQYLKVVWAGGQDPQLAEGYIPRGSHGEACAEAIAALAPEATYYLVSIDSLADRQALVGFLAEGTLQVDVISDSMYWPIPMDHNDGKGELALMAQEVVEMGIAYFKSVGNFGDGHDAVRAFYSGVFCNADGDSQRSHDFDPDATSALDRNTLAIEVAGFEFSTAQLRIVLEWDGWPWQVRDGPIWTHKSIISIQDLDLGLYYQQYPNGPTELVGRTYVNQLCTLTGPEIPQQPVEILSESGDEEYIVLDRPGTYLIRIWNETMNHDCGDCVLFERPVQLHLYVYVEGATFTLEHPSSDGCLINEAAGGVISVGAVGRTDVGWSAMPFSSRGPASDGRTKPDFVAPYGYESNSNSGYFAGTSAATSIAAGVGALVICASQLETTERLTHERLKAELRCGAMPLCGTSDSNRICDEDCKFNNVVGYGLVNGWNTYLCLTRE